MQRFTRLKVWQRGQALVLKIYAMTAGFAAVERYGLISQLRRAALSVPTYIAEASVRTGRQEYSRFLNIAEGSLAETEYLVIVAQDLNYAAAAMLKPLFAEIADLARMLHVLRLSVEAAKSLN